MSSDIEVCMDIQDLAELYDIIWEIFHRGHGLTIPTDIIIRMSRVLEK